MQGKHENKHQYKNYDSKDNVPWGSYVEVTGYYLNDSAENSSRGNNVYYQWGRKDPFIGTNANYANKVGYVEGGGYYSAWAGANPPRLTDDSADSLAVNRITTRNALHLLIQNPGKWHNPPRKEGTDGNLWASDNETYANLWEGRRGVETNAPTLKTVYDPCPVGYQVSHYNAFTGFTTTGDNTNISTEWYDVLTENVADGNPTEQLYEFYTSPEKCQSIIFPESGYRDWDSYAGVYHFGDIGYIWAAGNYKNDDNNSYNFKFSRKDIPNGNSYVRPKNRFYPCDGFPVRPCVYGKHGTVAP